MNCLISNDYPKEFHKDDTFDAYDNEVVVILASVPNEHNYKV